jgi:hypothetical protein
MRMPPWRELSASIFLSHFPPFARAPIMLFG